MNNIYSTDNCDVNANAYYVSSIFLSNFRNYDNLKLELNESPVVLTGQNGSGKTNILEAISLLSPGRGLRKAKLNEADKFVSGGSSYPWSISAIINKAQEETRIGTGRQLITDAKRLVKIDGDLVKSQSLLASYFSVMWLTPQMDGLFISSSSDRRKFLDRLVYNFDPEHVSRVYSYEYTMRERAKLLQENADPTWIDVLEAKMAERAISIAAARIDTISIIQEAILSAQTAFPKAYISTIGEVEKVIANNKSLEAEEIIKKQLFNARSDDCRTGRTSVGTHRSDLSVIHIDKNMPAALCSTGEQKALLLSIILAEARAKSVWKNNVPVLLLDEVVAHLDESRRHALFNEILNMKAQVWMTGTDISLFDGLQNSAQFLTVDNGVVNKQEIYLEY